MNVILGYGFLGKTLSNHFLRQQVEFRVGNRHINVPAENHHTYFDLHDTGTYAATFRDAETVIHLVHPTVPYTSALDPDVDLVHNIRSNEQLLQYLFTQKIKRILFISTGGAIYGEAGNYPVKEDHPCAPISNYGKGKLLLEKLYLDQCREHGVALTIIRPSNVYGKYQGVNKPQGVIAHILHAIQNNKPFTLWGSGTTQKDYLYAADLAAAIHSLLLAPNAKHAVYNLSSGKNYSILEIISTVEKILDKKLNILHEDEVAFDVKHVLLDSSRFASEFHWKANYSLEQGLLDMLKTVNA